MANAGIYAANITQALSKAAPDLAPVFHEAGDAYRRRLADLDREVRASFATVPPERRRIITSHDAFGYYGAAYGLTLLAPQGLSTESEPSAGSVAKLIRQIRTTGVKAIFIENVTDPRLMQRIARESGAVVGGELYSDALSGPDGPAATYIDMVRHNTRSIVAALSGKG